MGSPAATRPAVLTRAGAAGPVRCRGGPCPGTRAGRASVVERGAGAGVQGAIRPISSSDSWTSRTSRFWEIVSTAAHSGDVDRGRRQVIRDARLPPAAFRLPAALLWVGTSAWITFGFPIQAAIVAEFTGADSGRGDRMAWARTAPTERPLGGHVRRRGERVRRFAPLCHRTQRMPDGTRRSLTAIAARRERVGALRRQRGDLGTVTWEPSHRRLALGSGARCARLREHGRDVARRSDSP